VDRDQLVARHAAGRSFADVGALWNVDGAIAFAARAAGATRVTAVDVIPETPRFTQRNSAAEPVRFVHRDLHDSATVAEVGPHDVVWCSGVLYHAPHPLLTLERLHQLTAPGGTLLLATEVVPLPGRFALFAPPRWAHPGRPAPLDPARGYGNWFWLPTPATVRALLAAARFTVAQELRTGRWHRTVVAHPER